jgi:hypothetical protein
MKIWLAILGFAICSCASSQPSTNDTTAVVIRKDPRVDDLSRRQAATNAAIKKASARTMKGYRLLIVNTTKRNEAIDAKTKVYTYFPELKAYLLYQTPYFKLKAGNFRTRDEAEKYKKNLNFVFPKGVFIINDVIEIKPEKEATENKEI